MPKFILTKVKFYSFVSKLLIAGLLLGTILIFNQLESVQKAVMIMGGALAEQISYKDDTVLSPKTQKEDFEKFFRPSALPALNTKDLQRYTEAEDALLHTKPSLPKALFKTPEEALINYFSLLREAANPVEEKSAGCGTIGLAKQPYPVSYLFLSAVLQKKMSYDKYLKTFQNILHLSLIKYSEVQSQKNDEPEYFVEIETIEGNESKSGAFCYYYGFVTFVNENDNYKISDLTFLREIYLCAPYHGWFWDAPSNVQIRYGSWCNLIKGNIKTEQNDWETNILFTGTDGYSYKIQFFTLTNGTDIEIAALRKKGDGAWKRSPVNPDDCLKKNKTFKFF